MQSIFGLLYLVFLLGAVFTALFIVFHIAFYSFDRTKATFGILLFLGITLSLLFANTLVFFTLPFDDFLPDPSSLSL